MKKALAVLVLIGAAAVVCGSVASIESMTLGLAIFGELGLTAVLAIVVLAQKEG